jgi:hypothetical protein
MKIAIATLFTSIVNLSALAEPIMITPGEIPPNQIGTIVPNEETHSFPIYIGMDSKLLATFSRGWVAT